MKWQRINQPIILLKRVNPLTLPAKCKIMDIFHLLHSFEYASILLVIFYLIYFIRKRRELVQILNKLPGQDQIIGFFGDIFEIRDKVREKGSLGAGIYDLITEQSKKYSRGNNGSECGIWTLWITFHPIVITNNPNLIESILGKNGFTRKGKGYGPLRELLGKGLLTGNGDKWKQHRKIINRAFHPKLLDSFVPKMVKKAQNLVDSLKQQTSSTDGEIRDIREIMLKCSLEILCITQMQNERDKNDSYTNYVKNIYFISKKLVERLFSPLTAVRSVFKLTRPQDYSTYISQLRQVKSFIKENVKEFMVDYAARHRPSIDINWIYNASSKAKKSRPLMETLVKEHLTSPNEFTMKDVEDELSTFMAAGHDTTAWTLIWSMILLSTHPRWQDAIRHETEALFLKLSQQDRQLHANDVMDLVITDAVIKETLRLYPTAPFITRNIDRPFQFNEYEFPSGLDIAIPIWTVHRNENHWDEANDFLPERFLNDTPRHKYAYIPFSAGERNCIGQRFALLEAKVVLIHLIKNFILSPSKSFDNVNPSYAIINKSFSEIPLIFKAINDDKGRSERG